jgi:hypothetical protein
MEEKMDTYTNRDFYLSSYLIAAGIQLKSFHKTNGITTFEFDNSEKLQKLVQEYYSMNAFVNAMLYGSAIKNLKSILYSNTNTKSNYKYESPTLCTSK